MGEKKAVEEGRFNEERKRVNMALWRAVWGEGEVKVEVRTKQTFEDIHAYMKIYRGAVCYAPINWISAPLFSFLKARIQ